MARLALFIDGGYIDKLCEKEFGRARINFANFQSALKQIVADKTSEPLDLLRTLFYHCPPYQGNPPSEDEKRRTAGFRRFADALKGIDNFDFREGRLALRGYDKDGRPIFQQKRVDLLLGLDIALMSARESITHMGLITGDSDLIPAVLVAKLEGVNTWLFHGPKVSRADGSSTYSQDLWQEVDMRHEIDQALIDSVKR